MWWYQSGGTVTINWFLLTELPSFTTVFDSVLISLIPGAVVFVVTLYAKRRGWEPFSSWERRLRGAPQTPSVSDAELEVKETSTETETKSSESTDPLPDPSAFESANE